MDKGDLFIVVVIVIIAITVGTIIGLSEATSDEMEIVPSDDHCLTILFKDNRLFGDDKDYSGTYCEGR